MAGFWEREFLAAQERDRRAAEQRREAERRRFEEQRRRQQEEAGRRAEERRRAAESARFAALERARQAAMSRQPVVPPTRVVPEVRAAQQQEFWRAAARDAVRGAVEERYASALEQKRLEEAAEVVEALARAEEIHPTRTLFGPPVEIPSVEEFARRSAEQKARQQEMRPYWESILFGDPKESVAPGQQQAGRLESFLRTQAGEDEFRTAGQRFGGGRVGAGIGWGLLGLAGAVPFFGDIVQGATAASRAARAAGAAGDVARGAEAAGPSIARGRNIVDEISAEIAEKGAINFIDYTNPRIDIYPQERKGIAELAYRQGYEGTPRVVSPEEFNSLANSTTPLPEAKALPYEYPSTGKNVVVYRGIQDDATSTGMEYANQLISGDYFVGHGYHGHGIYFAVNPSDALGYSYNSGTWSGPPAGGSISRAIVPSNARLLDAKAQGAVDEFLESPFNDISEFAIANGYDGIRVRVNSDPSDDYVIILNRGILTFDTPRPVTVDDATIIYEGRVSRKQILDDIFEGTDYRRMATAEEGTEGLNF